MKQILLSMTFVVVAFATASAQHQPGMHFDQHATTHHFLLSATGGSIVVTANAAADTSTIAMVRSHLQDIAGELPKGNFDSPLITHGELPAGASVMIAKKDVIKYRYEQRPAGGAVIVSTTDPEALKGIHEFLRYQITEHKTGDPLTAQKK